MQYGTAIGIDAHSQVHAATAVDHHGHPFGQLMVGAAVTDLARLVSWIAEQPGPRLVAVEGAKRLRPRAHPRPGDRWRDGG